MTIPDKSGVPAAKEPQRLVVDFSDEVDDLHKTQPRTTPLPSGSSEVSPFPVGPAAGSGVPSAPDYSQPGTYGAGPSTSHPPPVIASVPLAPSSAYCATCGGALKVSDQFCARCGSVVRGRSTGPTASQLPPPMNAGPPCANCGQALGAGQLHCLRCGMPAAGQLGPPVSTPKDKSVAVLLAVFLSFWSWIYTYDRDKQKFWIGLGVGLGSAVFGALLLFPLIFPLGIWIWAIVDVCQKPDTYYRLYPRG